MRIQSLRSSGVATDVHGKVWSEEHLPLQGQPDESPVRDSSPWLDDDLIGRMSRSGSWFSRLGRPATRAAADVGNDVLRRGQKGYKYAENDPGGHGRYEQLGTEDGSRVTANHTNDPRRGPHFHAGQPKGDPSRTGVNFGWANTAEAERYGQVSGKHHDDH